MQAVRRRWQPLVLAALATVLVIGLVGAMSARGNGDDQEIRFPMVRSTAAVNAGCLANASAQGQGRERGGRRGAHAQGPGAPAVHELRLLRHPGAQHAVRAVLVPGRHRDRPPRQGASSTFVGRFNIETFIVAPGTAPAPMVHPAVRRHHEPGDAPVHTFHLGLWFNSPADAVKAGCPAHRHAVQRRPHRRHPGAEHPELRRRPGPAAAARALGGRRGPARLSGAPRPAAPRRTAPGGPAPSPGAGPPRRVPQRPSGPRRPSPPRAGRPPHGRRRGRRRRRARRAPPSASTSASGADARVVLGLRGARATTRPSSAAARTGSSRVPRRGAAARRSAP